jgi:hypothetical protein
MWKISQRVTGSLLRPLPCGASVINRLVGRGPEIEIDTRSTGGIPDALGMMTGVCLSLRRQERQEIFMSSLKIPSSRRMHLIWVWPYNANVFPLPEIRSVFFEARAGPLTAE